MSNEVCIGAPTMGLLPARNRKFTLSEVASVEVPIKGKFSDLDSEYFKNNDTEFSLYDNGILNVSSISKILFSAGKYPALEPTQMFCPISFVISDKTILIIGQVVTFLTEDEESVEDVNLL